MSSLFARYHLNTTVILTSASKLFTRIKEIFSVQIVRRHLFGHKGHLNVHIKTVHENQRNFECPVCKKSFGRKDTLNTHNKIVHENQRNFECPICKKSFGQKCDLDKHMKTVPEN